MTNNSPTPYGVTLDALNRYLQSLYEADWENPHGPIRLSSRLGLEDLRECEPFYNTRLFLAWLLEKGRVPMTATGNLTRKSVEELMDRLRLNSRYLDCVRSVCKDFNEQDVWRIHELRLMAQCGKLLVRRGKQLVVTKLGRELLEDARAGDLFRVLFLAFFRTLDISYMVNLREQPEIQATLAITLWRLEQVAENWRPVKGIAAQILPPRVATQLISAQQSECDTPDFFVCGYVLQPLREFGLLERSAKDELHVGENDSVRTTDLFRRFISFAPLFSPANN